MNAVKFIYGSCRGAGIADDDDRRNLYQRVTGKRSLREMTDAEQVLVVQELKRLSSKPTTETLSGPYAPKLQALWIAAYNLGIVRNKSDQALMAFVKRQCGIDHMRWLRDAGDAARVIEALKSWITRETGIDWNADTLFQSDAAKVAVTIFAKLHDDVPQGSEFQSRVAHILKRPVQLDQLSTRQWQTVCNALGVELRMKRRA